MDEVIKLAEALARQVIEWTSTEMTDENEDLLMRWEDRMRKLANDVLDRIKDQSHGGGADNGRG